MDPRARPQTLPAGSSSAINNMVRLFKQKATTMPPYVAFPITSMVFTYYLWVVMGFNGVGDALQVALPLGKYADGTPIKLSYTGIRPLDYVLSMVVAFEHPVTSSQDSAAWLLMFDVMSTLQTAIIWIFMDSIRKGRSSSWLAYPTMWCYATNGIGAAVVLPIYFWIQLMYKPTEEYIQLWNSAPLPNAFIAGAVIPGLAMMSAPLLSRSVNTHQIIIAVVQASPLLIAIFQAVGSALYPIRNLDIRRRRTAALPSLQQVLTYGAVFSAACHLFILFKAMTGTASLASVFIPNANAPLMASAETKMLEGSRYFLQWDLVGIAAACGLWCYYLVTELTEVPQAKLVAGLVGSTLVFGPGATTSAVLSWREGFNVAKAESKRVSRLVS